MDRPKGSPRGSRLPEATKRAILMLKTAHPDYGCQRISDLLARGPALGASATAVARVLHEAGYELEETPTTRHRAPARSFERAQPNALWQTDLFTFILKRQNRRVHLVAFMDDHSRFIVGYGVHATASTALVLETFRAAIASYQAPQEVLTDNGSQYVTWRGTSAFRKTCDKRGIAHLVARPRRPQTLGKIERFWGTLWRDCIETAVFLDLADARQRIGLFLDYYNFQRPHQGIGGLVPADRFFGAAPEVLATMKARIESNALEMARNGLPKRPFYLTGQLGDKAFSLHGEGDRIILRETDGRREEVALVMDEGVDAPKAPEASAGSAPGESAPGTSPLDTGLQAVAESLQSNDGEDPS
jgi:transposase InsO family protein